MFLIKPKKTRLLRPELKPLKLLISKNFYLGHKSQLFKIQKQKKMKNEKQNF